MKARLSAKPAQSVSHAPEIGQRLSPIETSEQPRNAPLSNLPGRPDLSFSLSRIPILGPGNSSEHDERRLQPSSLVTNPLQRSPLAGYTPERATQSTERPSQTIIQQLTRRATNTSTEPLPYANHIQRSFGHHNIDTIRVHRGPIARANARSVQARAFTTGNHIVFADTPDLHTAAHEAAHVIQQSNGVHLPEGIDTPGDRYERHAEAVAQRVVGGYSAESLLDHTPETALPHAKASGQMRVKTEDWGKNARSALAPQATGVSIQRVKMKALKGNELEPLLPEEQEQQRKALQKAKGEKTESLKNPLAENEIGKIRSALLEDAQRVLQSFSATRVKNPNEVRPEYKAILDQAVKDVLKEYGPYVEEADLSSLAKQTKQGGAQYQNVESRWEKLKASESAIKEEFPLALQYMFDNEEDFKSVQAILEEIAGKHEDNRVGVEEAYTKYVEEKPDAELSRTLVELRIRWSPYTINGTVYAEQQQDKVYDKASVSESKPRWLNQLKLDAWNNYKQMIHEVVHTAAHPKFKEYLDLLPAYVHNVIDEGTTDYFALEIWGKIQKSFTSFFEDSENFKIKYGGTGQKKVKPPKLGEKETNLVTLVHSIQEAIKKLSVNAQNLADLSSYKKAGIYQKQEAAIRSMTTRLKDGERRLKAAYFYGEVEYFFPPAELFLKEEEEGEDNEKQVGTIEEEGEGNEEEKHTMEEDPNRKRKVREEEPKIKVEKKLKEKKNFSQKKSTSLSTSLKEEESEDEI